jgi:hypothetical protein
MAADGHYESDDLRGWTAKAANGSGLLCSSFWIGWDGVIRLGLQKTSAFSVCEPSAVMALCSRQKNGSRIASSHRSAKNHYIMSCMAIFICFMQVFSLLPDIAVFAMSICFMAIVFLLPSDIEAIMG